MAQDLMFNGVSVAKAYETLVGSGIREAAARDILGAWLGRMGDAPATFDYSKPLTAHDPACEPAPFERLFSHADWVDGTSVVQAGETPTEQGFNRRFHQIETDLDSLGALLAQAFRCNNSVRETVAGALKEIADELNRLNAKLAELRTQSPDTSVRSPIGDNGWRYVGRTQYFGNTVLVYQDGDGRMVNLPDYTTTTTILPDAGTRATKAADLLGRDGDIIAELTGPFTKEQLVSRFGSRLSSDGTSLAELVQSLPATARFSSPDDLITQLAEQDSLLMKGLGADTRVRVSLGLDEAADPAKADVTRLQGVTPELGTALVKAGIKTVGDLGTMSTGKLMDLATSSGLSLGASTAGGILAMGKTVVGLGR